jgi:fermentation-respiration switch protein FrsA (DUF1100 family)
MIVPPLALLLGCAGLDGFFFNPRRVDAYDLSSDVLPAEQVEEVSFTSLDGTTLYGAWIHQPEPAPILIYFHGNDSDLSAYWDRMELQYSWGFDTFIFDYRCYGRSEGECSYDGVLEQDGLAAVQYVADTTGVAPSEMVWWGHSLGGSAIIHTNDEIEAAAVMIESTFASANDIGDDAIGLDLPVGWFFRDDFDNVAEIPNVQSPIFIIHGLGDDYILTEYANKLYNAAPDPKALWQPDGCGHSTCPSLLGDEFRDRALGFYADHGVSP